MDSPARPTQAKMASSTGGTEGSSPASSPASAASLAAMAAPKFGTLVPNRIFVGGISASTSEAELAQLFSAYGNVKATKIIADRGGVSKGYGFVTFETEEEAKRLQQEPECIVLRERKLNIAPAIKKQPFNRSFDGGTGSPPAVPTSTYYYTNGMGLPYQNGMTFYNAGAPAPGAAIAPPADPATLYQAAGVFGPQATTSHQTFAPVMYPVPAPSLYMPQQYQYSPMPYEPYFPGTTAAGAPQFLYATNGAQTSGSGNGSGNNSSGTAAAAAAVGANATSPPSAGPSALGPSPPQFQTHFYGPAGAATATHHHPGAMTGGPHGPPPPPPPHMEHLYYSYPAPPHAAAQPPPHHGGPLTLATDQQLLIYSTEISAQPSANESQVNQQEDSRSPSSHSEQLQQVGGAATSDGGGGTGGGGGQPSDPSASVVLMPLKYPSPNRYPNFHPMTVHHSTTLPHQDPGGSSGGVPDNGVTAEEAAVHFRGMSIYPTPTTLYIPHGAPYHTGTGNSLLPTPPQQPFDLSSGKFRDYSKPLNRPAAGPPLLHHPPPSYVKQYNGPPPLQGASPQQKYPRVTTPPARMHQYGKRGSAGHHQSLGSPTTYYFSHKSCPQYGGAGASPRQQQFVYAGGQAQIPPYAMPNIQKGYLGGGAGYEYGRSEHEGGGRQRKNAIVNSYRGSNLTISANTSNLSNSSHVDANHASSSNSRPGSTKAQTSENVKNAEPSSEISNAPIAATTTTTTTSSSSNATATNATTTKAGTDTAPAAKDPANRNNNSSSRASSHSPMTHPLPNLSPSPNPNQVQFFGPSSAGGGGGGGGSGSQRYNSSSTSGGLPHHQQQQRSSNSRYSMTSSSSSTRGGGKSSSVLRQSSGGGGAGKYKMNGIVQSSGKLPVDEASLGGAGDAPPVGRMPLTPPTTPQQTTTSTGDQNQQLNETCHQMQALSL